MVYLLHGLPYLFIFQLLKLNKSMFELGTGIQTANYSITMYFGSCLVGQNFEINNQPYIRLRPSQRELVLLNEAAGPE